MQSRCRNLGKEKDAGGRRRTVDAGGDLAAARPGTLEGEQEEETYWAELLGMTLLIGLSLR